MPRSLVRAIEVAVMAAMGVVSVVVVVEVILRYTLGETLVVTEELSRYLMVWIAFLGSVLLMRERGHIAAEGLGSWLGPLGRRVIGIVADLLSLVFPLTLTVAGFQTLPAQLDQYLRSTSRFSGSIWPYRLGRASWPSSSWRGGSASMTPLRPPRRPPRSDHRC